MVSKHWLEASLHSSVTQRRLISIRKDRLKNGVSYNEIIDSKIPYTNLKIGKSNACLKHNSFWRTISDNLRFLALTLESFQNCSDFIFTLKFLVNLETLNLFIESFDTDMVITSKDVFELKNLNTLRYHSELENDSMLKQILSVMPNIVHWDLLYDQPSNQTIHETILNYLTNGKDRIETLVLKSNLTTIQTILNLTGMNLTTLSLDISDNYWNDSDDSDVPDDRWQGTPCEKDYRSLYSKIESFTDDKKLLRIKLSNSSLYDLIDTNFPNLEEIYLELTEIKIIAEKLEKITKFETIHFYKDNGVINMDVDVSHAFKEEKKNLKKLILFCDSDPQWLLSSAVSDLSSFKNLTYLIFDDCGFNHDQEPRELFEKIFKMKQLKYLYINDNLIDFDTTDESERDYDPFEQAYGITDGIFTGQEETEDGDEPTGYSIANLKNLEELHVNIKNSNLGNETLLEISKLPKLKSLSIGCGWVNIFVKFLL